MTTSNSQKVRIALFAIAAGVLFTLVLIVFAGLHFWKDRAKYHIVVDHSVYGLQRGADVYFNGVRVGTVTDIGIDPKDVRLVRLDIEVDAKTPIHADTKAILQFAGITGLKVIDLRDGTSQTPLLAENSRIEEGETLLDKLEEKGMKIVDETSELMKKANDIVAQSEQVVDNLAALTSPTSELMTKANGVIAQSEQVVSNLAALTNKEQMGALMEQTKKTAANLALASASLKGLVDDNRDGLKASIASIELAAKRTAELVDNGQLRSAVSDLKQASRSFKELARDVKQKPSRLFFSSPTPDRKMP